MKITNLSYEILSLILEELDVPDILKIGYSCKYIIGLVHSKYFIKLCKPYLIKRAKGEFNGYSLCMILPKIYQTKAIIKDGIETYDPQYNYWNRYLKGDYVYPRGKCITFINGCFVDYFNLDLMDLDLWNLAISKDIFAFELMPKKYQSIEMITNLLELMPNLFHFFDDNLLTKDICDRAIELDKYTLINIPRKFQTKRMLELVLNSYPSFIKVYSDDLFDQKISNKFFNGDHKLFMYIPERYQSNYMVKRFLDFKSWYSYYKWYPENMKDQDLRGMISWMFNADLYFLEYILKRFPNIASSYFDFLRRCEDHYKKILKVDF